MSLAYYQIPAVTYSESDVPTHNHQQLDDLGHFFHLPCLNHFWLDKLTLIIVQCLIQLPRLQKLRQDSAIQIDRLGRSRVVDLLINNEGKEIELPPIKNHLAAEQIAITSELYILPVQDKHINLYFEATQQQMGDQGTFTDVWAKKIDHYQQWLKEKPNAYFLYQSQQPLILLWHQTSYIDLPNTRHQCFVYISWHALESEQNLQYLEDALSWYLNWLKQRFHDAICLTAFPKKDSKALSAAIELGFKLSGLSSNEQRITKMLAPKATSDAFVFCHLILTQQCAAPIREKVTSL